MRRFGEAEVAPARPRLAPRQRLHPLEVSPRWRSSASSGSRSRRNTAAWASPRSPCAWSRRSCRGPISASAPSAPARRSPRS
jgi:hypothetical protein